MILETSTLYLAKIVMCFRVLDINCFKFRVGDLYVDRVNAICRQWNIADAFKVFHSQFVFRTLVNEIAKDLTLLVSNGRKLNNINQDIELAG